MKLPVYNSDAQIARTWLRLGVKCSLMERAKFDPNKLAVLYYFGDLSYWQLPDIFADALGHGFDGRALRRLARLVKPVERDIRPEEIDSVFREMGVVAPVPKDEARLTLATEAARRAVSGESNVFDEATHIRIHICNWNNAPPELRPIVALSAESEQAPRRKWKQLEQALRDAMADFLSKRR
ncbi:MAG TPA: hypothetical protein VH079_05860 [Terriglobales bacterium]|nr:hypothetical protein [Terriglobales bacterium]